MANDHPNFDCQQCGAHFHSREELDRHNRQQHIEPSSQAGAAADRPSQRNSSASGIDNRDLQR